MTRIQDRRATNSYPVSRNASNSYPGGQRKLHCEEILFRRPSRSMTRIQEASVRRSASDSYRGGQTVVRVTLIQEAKP